MRHNLPKPMNCMHTHTHTHRNAHMHHANAHTHTHTGMHTCTRPTRTRARTHTHTHRNAHMHHANAPTHTHTHSGMHACTRYALKAVPAPGAHAHKTDHTQIDRQHGRGHYSTPSTHTNMASTGSQCCDVALYCLGVIDIGCWQWGGRRLC